jgi:hypothetical protein
VATIVSNANKRRGRWISMLQDFHFRIVHWLGSKHSNFDALNKNLMFVYKDNEDFQVEIRDQTMSSFNSAMEKEVRFVTKNIESPELPYFFTLSKVIDDMLLETTRKTDPIIQNQELVLEE